MKRPNKPFHPSLIFASKAKLSPNEAPFRYSPEGKAPGLTGKCKTRPERLARDK
jgi:hypothetical protein